MKKMFLTVALAIAGTLSIEKSNAHEAHSLMYEKTDGSNYSLAEMRAIKPRFMTREAYMQYVAEEMNSQLLSLGFVKDESDTMYCRIIANIKVYVPVFNAKNMEDTWDGFTFEENTVIDGPIQTVEVFDDGHLKHIERLQRPGENFFDVDLADLRGFERLRSAGWHCRIRLVFCTCGNPVSGVPVFETLPPAGTTVPLTPTDLVATPAPVENTYNTYNTYNTTDANENLQNQPSNGQYGQYGNNNGLDVAIVNGVAQLGSAMLLSGAFGASYLPVGTQMYVPQSCNMQIGNTRCNFHGQQGGYQGGQWNNNHYCQPHHVFTGNGNNGTPTVINTDPHVAPGLKNTVVNTNNHVTPGGNGTGNTQNNGTPPLNTDTRKSNAGAANKSAAGGTYQNGHYVSNAAQQTRNEAQANFQKAQTQAQMASQQGNRQQQQQQMQGNRQQQPQASSQARGQRGSNNANNSGRFGNRAQANGNSFNGSRQRAQRPGIFGGGGRGMGNVAARSGGSGFGHAATNVARAFARR